jgi:hypothetical protein
MLSPKQLKLAALKKHRVTLTQKFFNYFADGVNQLYLAGVKDAGSCESVCFT